MHYFRSILPVFLMSLIVAALPLSGRSTRKLISCPLAYGIRQFPIVQQHVVRLLVLIPFFRS